ncbi:CHAT domain-containing protein [Halalkalibaculum sp. DA384]|uniref:CHAT domain-containing protein n=1 Tax=Halalkalibaculum sp. DA384 TaxID=3373606 RepID=UPI003754674B
MQTQGVYLYQIGKIQQAQDIFQEVLKRATEENIPVNKTSLYHNLSITHFKSGNFDKYLEIQFQALELAQKEQNYEHQFKILQNLHIFYRRNGDISSSLRYINEALKLSKRHGNIEDLGSIFVSLGVFYRDLKSNPDSAATYFQKADSVINRQQNFNLYFKLLTEKARLYETQNKFQQALNIYRSTKQTVRSQKNTQTYLHALVDEARILLKLDKISEVGEVIAILNNSDLSLLDFAQIVKAKTLEANYLITTGEPNSAYEILKPTIRQVVERAQSSTDLQSGFWSIEQEYLDAFKLFVDLLIETDRPGEAALALDQLKTINDAAFYQDPMVKAQQLNESELTQYRQLANNLDQLRKQKLSASSRERVQIQNKIDRLNAQKRALDRKITQYADKPTINMHQVQRQLSSNDLILHITELKETYYLASITKRNIDFHKVDLDEQTRALFDQSIQALSTGETDLNKLYRLGKKLNISELASSIENVILIPDSYLFQLPMDILPLTPPSSHYSYGEPTYFIEQYRTEYLTSLNEFVHGAQPDKSFNWDYVGFGISEFNNAGSELMPLPYARREILQISRELTNLEDHRTILEEQSTEEAFRAAAPKARILHLATHSTVSEQDPLFSRIYMSSPAGQTETEQFNSQIFAYELFEMNLTNDLIMLNSCESGSGSYLQGSGIVGISRALRYAGAESLVLNLWSVNDMMASDFATRFYRALNDGDSKSEALRKAKVYFLKQKNANPHYWGPYMLIGSSQAVVKPMQSSNIYVASGFMLYLIVMVSLSYMAQQQNIPTGNKRE